MLKTHIFRKRKHESEGQPPRKRFKLESSTTTVNIHTDQENQNIQTNDNLKTDENEKEIKLSPKIQEKRRQLALRSPFRDLLKKTLIKNHRIIE